MDPRIKAVEKELSRQQMDKTIQQIKINIARRERIAYGDGVLWTVFTVWGGMTIVYLIGSTPNPGIMLVPLIYGLYNKYGKKD